MTDEAWNFLLKNSDKVKCELLLPLSYIIKQILPYPSFVRHFTLTKKFRR